MLQQQTIPTHHEKQADSLQGYYYLLLTCLHVLVEPTVLGVLEQGQALLYRRPDIRLRTQQVRGLVLALARRKEEKRAVASVAPEPSGYSFPHCPVTKPDLHLI